MIDNRNLSFPLTEVTLANSNNKTRLIKYAINVETKSNYSVESYLFIFYPGLQNLYICMSLEFMKFLQKINHS